MKLGYVVLYSQNPQAALEFWRDRIGMQIQSETTVGDYSITTLARNQSDAALQLVPLELMKDNPDNLDLATPSLCFYVDDLESEREQLIAQDVKVTEIVKHGQQYTFGFCDIEDRWFAVMQQDVRF